MDVSAVLLRVGARALAWFNVSQCPHVPDERPDLLFRQAGMQEGVRVVLVLRALGDRIVELFVAHVPDPFRPEVRHIQFRCGRRVSAPVLGMTARALLRVGLLGILSKRTAAAHDQYDCSYKSDRSAWFRQGHTSSSSTIV